MEKLSPEQRQEIAGKGGRAWWDKLTEEEKRKAIERIQKARKQKRVQIAESGNINVGTSARVTKPSGAEKQARGRKRTPMGG
jgi:hypothetical protein